jgi:hypothetical protein
MPRSIFMFRLPADRSFNFVELKEGIHSDAGCPISWGRLPKGVGQEASWGARRFGFQMEASLGARRSRADRAVVVPRPNRRGMAV